MRAPPMPANSAFGRRRLSAAMRCEASRSPEASPATMPTRKELAIGLADDAALGAVEKLHELAHMATCAHLRLELRARRGKRKTAAVERPVGALERCDVLGREAAALEPFAVDAIGPRHVSGGGDEGRQVLRQVGAHAGEGVRADVHELVHERRGAEDRPVAHGNVAGELAGVGEDGVAADLAVVREVDVGHDPVVVADARHSRIERRAAGDRHVLADGIVVADLHRGVLAGVFLVLRRRTERGEMENAVAAADTDAPVQHHVGADPCALADLDLRADHAVGADADAFAKLRRAIDDRAGMDLRLHLPIAWTVQRIVASATIWPPTRATQANLPMPRSERSSTTSSSS